MFGVKNLTSTELFDRLEKDKIYLIDVRSPNEISQASIKNHVPIPLHLIPLELDKIKVIKEDIVIYCRTGARSAQACAFLMNNGVDDVINLEGGILSWARAGLEVEYGN